jgi:hypothetical protein
MRSTSYPRNRAVRPVLPYTEPYTRALLTFSHRPQQPHLKSPHRHPLPSKRVKVVSREQHQVQCGASEEIQLISHNKRLQEGSSRKAQSDQEAKLYQCLHVNEVLAVASSSSSPPKNNDEPGPKKSHTAQQERSFESKRENPTKYNTKPGNSDKEVFQSFVDSNILIHS